MTVPWDGQAKSAQVSALAKMVALEHQAMNWVGLVVYGEVVVAKCSQYRICGLSLTAPKVAGETHIECKR